MKELKNYFKYEFTLLKKNVIPFLLFSLLLITLLTILTLLPFSLKQYSEIAYPTGITKDMLLAQYQIRYQEKINLGINDEETRLLFFFIKNGITQYDFVPYSSLHNIHKGLETVAIGLSFLEGASFVFIIAFSFLGANLFAYPLAKNSLKQCILIGGNRKKILLTKLIIIFATSVVFSVIVGLIGFAILNKNGISLTVYSYHDSYALTNVWNIAFSKTVSLFLLSVLFSLLSSFLGMFAKKELLSAITFIVLFMLFFVFANYSYPKWGNYGELNGASYWLIVFMPLSNLMMVSSFGFLTETYIIYSLYLLICFILSFLIYKKICTVSL